MANMFAFPKDADLQMKIDVEEDDKGFIVKADIPGVNKEDIQIDIDDDQVSLRAYGMVRRSFTLPADVDAKAAKAEYKGGVLTLALPKKPNGSAKRVAVS